ncbi:MAG TPA: VWA domain-containing protein [Pyrinomonadaceae bacterium]|nr:VWA domain-containing protein [Pyrinomonadaceae bacterium]
MEREFHQLLSGFLLNLLLICVVTGQVKTQTPQQEQADDIVRVKTELVQTDVTVVDKRGRFVGGLRDADFELRVDSKPQSLSFFEEVATGSVDEEKQLAAARKGDKLPATSDSATDRGRVVFFFVDDVHLTSEGLTRARTVITHFVENKMTAKDRVAVVSTSGQIGFLQQLTDNKAVLREAVSRLNSKYNPETTAKQGYDQ